MMLSTKDALAQALADMRKMSPEQLRAELDLHKPPREPKPMTQKLSKRHAMRMAVQNAAMVVRESDLESLFGDLWEEYCGDDDALVILSDAKDKVVKRIENMVKE